MSVKKIAISAVAVALLIAVQFAFSALPGVELVSVLFISFCFVFGAGMGAAVATCFSLLRCFLFGFNPAVIVLYLVYFNLLALLFGGVGRNQAKIAAWVTPLLLACLAVGSLYFALAGIPVSPLVKARLNGFLWGLFALSCALLLGYFALLFFCRKESWGMEGKLLSCVTALSACATVCFTLLDDFLTPFLFSYTPEAALGYFYASFTVMIPQTVCVAVSVFLLFPPLKKVLFSVAKSAENKK